MQATLRKLTKSSARKNPSQCFREKRKKKKEEEKTGRNKKQKDVLLKSGFCSYKFMDALLGSIAQTVVDVCWFCESRLSAKRISVSKDQRCKRSACVPIGRKHRLKLLQAKNLPYRAASIWLARPVFGLAAPSWSHKRARFAGGGLFSSAGSIAQACTQYLHERELARRIGAITNLSRKSCPCGSVDRGPAWIRGVEVQSPALGTSSRAYQGREFRQLHRRAHLF